MSFFYYVAKRASGIIGPDSLASRVARPLTEQLIRWAVGRHGLPWEINGVPCRIGPQFRAQLARTYDAELAGFLRGKVRAGHTCLDVGANIGAWVIQFAHWVGPSGRVVAFEPNPEARAVLAEHIGLNHLEPVTQIVPAAVGAEAGQVTFFATGADGMSRVGEPNPLMTGEAVPITVRVVTLDGWCRANAVVPDWLFIDVEGFEGHVLAGAAELIRSRGPALSIIAEMHPSLWPASGTTRDEVAGRVATLGRRPVPLTGQADPLTDYGHVLLEPI